MRREDGRISLSPGTLLAYVVYGGAMLAGLAVCTAIILTAIIDEPPPFLLVAFVLLIVLRTLLWFAGRVRFLVRRRARLRRMRHTSLSGAAE